MHVPDFVDKNVRFAFEYMDNDPLHQLSPIVRKRIYVSASTVLSREAMLSLRGNLAIASAEHVIPIFESFLSFGKIPKMFENTPKSLIVLSRRIVDGKVHSNSQPLGKFTERLHYIIGNHWGLGEEEIPNNVYFAGQATYHTLLEARGFDLLERVSDPLVTDKYLVAGGLGDTASSAAMASAFGSDGKMNPQALFFFWSWWLLEALPEAFQKATQERA